MALYYADFSASGGGNSGTQANPWESMADVRAGTNSTPPTAGDSVFCKGTEVLSAAQVWDIAGSAASGYVKMIGVNASWVNDGTLVVVDGNGGAYGGVNFQGAGFNYWENWKVINCGTTTSHDGFFGSTSNSNDCTFVNCVFGDPTGVNTNTGNGFGINQWMRHANFFRCRFTNNGLYGADQPRFACIFEFCTFDNNSNRGANDYQSYYADCLFYDNGAEGLYGFNLNGVRNSVAHGNTLEGFDLPSSSTMTRALTNCRSTDNGTGVTGSSSTIIDLFYYYGQSNTTATSGNMEQIIATTAGSDTDFGYTSSATDDYTLDSGATYYDEEVKEAGT